MKRGLKKGQKVDQTTNKMKAAGIKDGIGRRKGAWELEKEKLPVAGAPKPQRIVRKNRSPLALPEQALLEMARDKAGGMSDIEVGKKYLVSAQYVNDAMRTLFINSKVGREILKGVLLDNAIAGGMKVRQSIEDLTPMQAVMATSAMTQRFIDIDKHNSNMQTSDIDFTELTEIGNMLRELNSIAGVGPIIDVESVTDSDDGS